MLQIIAGSWPIAVMFIATLAALIALRVMRMAEKARVEDRAYRASQARDVAARIVLVALCATSLLVYAGGAIAAELAVPGPIMVGGTPMGGGSAPVVHRKKRVETEGQFMRRVSRPYPGKME